LKIENALPGTGAPVLDPADLLTGPQLAKRLHVSMAWIYDKTKKSALHPLPVLRVGHFVRFDWRAVCEWMSQRKAA
jgi:predicted DNA-binding transcriptional regulator AlpA